MDSNDKQALRRYVLSVENDRDYQFEAETDEAAHRMVEEKFEDLSEAVLYRLEWVRRW